MNAVRWTVAVVGAALILVAVMFTVQNLGRTTELSLDLWVVAWRLRQPVPVPVALWIALGSGFVLGAALVLFQGSRARSRARQRARARSSLGDSHRSADDWA